MPFRMALSEVNSGRLFDGSVMDAGFCDTRPKQSRFMRNKVFSY